MDQMISTVSIRQVLITLGFHLRYHNEMAIGCTFSGLQVIGHAWTRKIHYQNWVDYILLLNQSDDPSAYWKSERPDITIPIIESQDPASSRHIEFILGFIRKELDQMQAKFDAGFAIDASSSKQSIACVLFSFCLSCGSFAARLSPEHRSRGEAILKKSLGTIKSLLSSYHGSNLNQTSEEGLLIVMARWSHDTSTYSAAQKHLHISFFREVAAELMRFTVVAEQERRVLSKENSLDDIVYGSDPDIQALTLVAGTQFRRHALPAETDQFAFICSIRSYVRFIACSEPGDHEDAAYRLIAVGFVDYLTALPIEDFLACRPLLKMLFASNYRLSNTTAKTLLIHLEDNVLFDCYEFERCEIATGICANLLTRTADKWLADGADHLAGDAADLYQWLLKITVHCTSVIQVEIVDLLLVLLHLQPDYVPAPASRSVRTELFAILRQGDVVVQQHIAKTISRVFDLFVADQHDLIFEDVFNSLPRNIENIEGILVRLFVFSEIASHCRSLIRRCLYHILETVHAVQGASKHAEMCIVRISTSANLQRSSQLFQLYSSQLLHTWLASQSVRTLPWHVFGYSSLEALLRDVQSEVTAQLIVKGALQDLKIVQEELKITHDTLLQQSFDRSAAYAIAADSTLR